MPGGHPGLDPSIRSLVGRVPFWTRGNRPQAGGAASGRGPLPVGGFFSNGKNTPHAPKKNSGRDGVVTSSLSLAAAQGAPAHSFRCSSFSHRKRCTGLRWEPCNFPPRPTLKRPKEGLRPFLWKPLFGDGREMGGGVSAVIPGVLVCGRRGWGGLADFEPALGVHRLWPL